jgi:hypothetical protein
MKFMLDELLITDDLHQLIERMQQSKWDGKIEQEVLML